MHRKSTISSRQRSPKEKFWNAHLAALKNSGLSQAEYCRRTHLSKSTFNWWKRRLQSQKPASLELVPVSIVGDRATDHDCRPSYYAGLTLITCAGHRIEIDEHFRPAVLERLLQALGRS